MSELYPPESQQMGFIGHLDELRRRILHCLLFYAVTCGVLLAFGRSVLMWLEWPARKYLPAFIVLSPTEAFSAYLKVVLLAGFVISFPFLLYELWAFLAPALSLDLRRAILLWLLLAVLFFISGILFAFHVLLPSAMNFLIGFANGIAQPMISLGEYVSFAVAFIFVGGVVFEIPVVIAILAEAGVMDARRLRLGRKYAVLINLIVAAVITPTQDAFNMLIFALPMLALYEFGILLAAAIERRKTRTRS